ncbi:hypothetical protein [Streptomyces sp. NBC_01185]|uniref:hypothetical protein n=1 Tax=Streptomyces sp. NBC_01185 TaxID=2903764 RepID=UPI00386FEE2A|nr:hypothetical protein OG770_32220 [Streptomyces sp. NBC_01185]
MVYVSLDGEAGPLVLGLPESVRLCLVAPWWRDAPGALARLVEFSRGPVAAACLVVGYEGNPLHPLFAGTPS